MRWYCRYSLSYRNMEELMRERGLRVDHTTVFRCVQRYAPEINKRTHPHLKLAGASYRIDETYIKMGKQGISDKRAKLRSVQFRRPTVIDTHLARAYNSLGEARL
jgi:transposase-like protein